MNTSLTGCCKVSALRLTRTELSLKSLCFFVDLFAISHWKGCSLVDILVKNVNMYLSFLKAVHTSFVEV